MLLLCFSELLDDFPMFGPARFPVGPRFTTIQLTTGRLINPRQRQDRDLAFGLLLIIVKERHQAGLRVKQTLPFCA
jgi:hypothetical protein